MIYILIGASASPLNTAAVFTYELLKALEIATVPGITWLDNTWANTSLSMSLSIAPSKNVVKASLVGANTVKSPLVSDSKFTKVVFPSSVSAATNELSAGFVVANVTIVGSSITVSTIWTIPLSASTSGVVTVDWPLITTPLVVSIYISILAPLDGSVARFFWYPVERSVDANSTLRTWFNKICVNASLSTSSRGVPFKNVSKAALVGANTVKLPVPANVASRPVCCKAANNELKSGLLVTISAIVFGVLPIITPLSSSSPQEIIPVKAIANTAIFKYLLSVFIEIVFVCLMQI